MSLLNKRESKMSVKDYKANYKIIAEVVVYGTEVNCSVLAAFEAAEVI